MSDAILLALIVAVPAMASPLLMAWLTNRNRRLEKQEDYARQDAVAEKAAEAAKLLLDRQAEVKEATEEAARLLKENNKTVADTAAATQTQLKVLTGMVDGNFTRLMEAELEAISHGLVLSRQVIALTFAAGHEPPTVDVEAIKATEAKIVELKKTIADRHHTEAAMALRPAIAGPLPVTDDRTAVAAERSAKALERAADAAEDNSGLSKKT